LLLNRAGARQKPMPTLRTYSPWMRRVASNIAKLLQLLKRSSTIQTSADLTRSFIEYGIPQQTSPVNQTPSRLTGKHRVAVRIAAIRSGYTQLVAPVCFPPGLFQRRVSAWPDLGALHSPP